MGRGLSCPAPGTQKRLVLESSRNFEFAGGTLSSRTMGFGPGGQRGFQLSLFPAHGRFSKAWDCCAAHSARQLLHRVPPASPPSGSVGPTRQLMSPGGTNPHTCSRGRQWAQLHICPCCCRLSSLAGQHLALLQEPFSSSSWGERKLPRKPVCPPSAAGVLPAQGRSLGRELQTDCREENACHGLTATRTRQAPSRREVWPTVPEVKVASLDFTEAWPRSVWGHGCDITEGATGAGGGRQRPPCPLSAVFCSCD